MIRSEDNEDRPDELEYQGFGKNKIVFPLNSAADRWMSQDLKPDMALLPLVIICADANGYLGGLESVISRLRFPCFFVDALRNEHAWSAKKMEDVASLVLVALQQILNGLKTDQVVIFSGLGFGAVLAHALVVHAQGVGIPGSLVLFEGQGALIDDANAIDWIPQETRILLQQVAAQAYEIACHVGGVEGLSKEALLVRLCGEKTLLHVFELLESLRPEEYSSEKWMTRIEAMLLRFAVYRQLATCYSPDEHSVRYDGQATCFLQAERILSFEKCINEWGGPDHMWESIVEDLQPMSTFLFPRGHAHGKIWSEEEIMDLEVTMDYVARLQSRSFRYRAIRLVAALENAAMKAVSAQKSGGYVEKGISSDVEEGSDWMGEESEENENASDDEDVEPPIFCLVEPLNDACESYDPEKDCRSMRNDTSPFWFMHTETGDISQEQRIFATMFERPCFGIALGPDLLSSKYSDEVASVQPLARLYVDAILAMQPQGPCYFLVASGTYIGASLAHHIACILERSGLPAAIFLIDATLAWSDKSSNLFVGQGKHSAPLRPPDATTCALFHFLRDMGLIEAPFSDFQKEIQSCDNPWDQLKLIDTKYRPQDTLEDEEAGRVWDQALVVVLEKCGFLNRLLKKQDQTRANKNYKPDSERFEGPGTLFVPHGMEGFAFEVAAQPFLAVNERGGVDVVSLLCDHGESLRHSEGRKLLVRLLTKAAVRARRYLIENQESEIY